MKQFDADEFRAYVKELWGPSAAPHVIAQVHTWITAGDGVAIYTNREIGNPEMGYPQLLRYGPGATFKEPPERLPDTATEINWRYVLTGTYSASQYTKTHK